MTPNDDLARWGEPPATEAELAQAERLSDWLEPSAALRGEAAPAGPTDGRLLETSGWIEDMMTTVLLHAGLFDNPPLPADAGGAAPTPGPLVELVLRVWKEEAPGRFRPAASTHPRPLVLRDLRRVPDDIDRVTLHTGDRVRLEVQCDRDGFLTVFNVGPGGTVNLLFPDPPAGASALPAHAPLVVADVVMTPPAGRERVYAVWSRVPLGPQQLAWLAGPSAALRDVQRVQETLTELRPEDWHAVLVELQHVP